MKNRSVLLCLSLLAALVLSASAEQDDDVEINNAGGYEQDDSEDSAGYGYGYRYDYQEKDTTVGGYQYDGEDSTVGISAGYGYYGGNTRPPVGSYDYEEPQCINIYHRDPCGGIPDGYYPLCYDCQYGFFAICSNERLSYSECPLARYPGYRFLDRLVFDARTRSCQWYSVSCPRPYYESRAYRRT